MDHQVLREKVEVLVFLAVLELRDIVGFLDVKVEKVGVDAREKRELQAHQAQQVLQV